MLTGLISFLCFSAITVGLLVLRYRPPTVQPPFSTPIRPAGPAPTHTVTHVQVTGLSQYPLAEAEARHWSADAQLISASANWPNVINQEQIGQPGQWTYRFYSPGKERLFIVKVEADGQTQTVEHVVQITLPPPALQVSDWLIDSPAALARWLDYGGADLVRRNPGLEVFVQLRALDNHPNPVWAVIGADKRTQDILTVVIDTNDGAVLATTSSSG